MVRFASKRHTPHPLTMGDKASKSTSNTTFMAPEHDFYLWNNPINRDRLPENFDKGLAVMIFREGRRYEQIKQQEERSRKAKK